MTDTFVGARLRLARMAEGLTLAQLGKRVAASGTLLSLIENDTRTPKLDLWIALADVLEVMPEFFAFDLVDEVKDGECNWRSLTSTPVGLRKQVAARASLFAEAVGYLDFRLNLPKYSIPSVRLSDNGGIEKAADLCREHFNCGPDRPIGMVNRVLENNGIVLTELDAESAKVDAFSRPGPVNIVVLNSYKNSASRTRYDMAHELGHFVLHGKGFTTEDKELEAERFAAAFLLPKAQFTKEFWRKRRVDWGLIFELKRRWKVSAAAIVRRAVELDLLDAADYRIAYRYIYRRGWHRGEPDEPAERERPELFKLALKKLEEAHGETPYDVAKALEWRPARFEAVTGVVALAPRQSIPGIVSLDSYRQNKKAAGGG